MSNQLFPWIHKKACWLTRPILSSEVTPEDIFVQRRKLMQGIAMGMAVTPFLSPLGLFAATGAPWHEKIQSALKDPNHREVGRPETPYDFFRSYNNFYEFGSDKKSPAKLAGSLKTEPWTIRVSGAVKQEKTLDLNDFLKPHQLQDRVYRFRCVEAWAMVVPWLGVPLMEVLKQVEPLGSAKFVQFKTLLDPNQFPQQKNKSIIDWPYAEGLRLDEAMNPLALLVVGAYGKVLPNQNGAPIRLVVPWKYGFKSIKSIVSIELVEKMPSTSWHQALPNEYGFFANVNPDVRHPRWSQKRERLLPSSFFSPNWQPTLMFNGYEDQVAALYQGMDLTKNF